ncbi:MAG TPA: amidohydrolase family protein, partial [Spirochaetia bacterium]|nr:amidohydrolase family protein [Spirochaetia bacterium]
MNKIDAHIHFYGSHPDDIGLLRKLDIKLLNICVADGPEGWEEQKRHYRSLSKQYPESYSWCTTFDPPRFIEKDSDYVERVIAGLSSDFDSGASACKIWKNIGMEVKRPDGEFIMVDDPLFRPIFEFIRESGRPVLMHIAEPLACWQPLDESSPHYGYYKENPQWHMYGRAGFPSHARLIAARDRVLEAHPGVQFVGAHLGSLEYDLAEVARRLDSYPNFTVDTSARMLDLMVQDSGAVREFITKYSDRVLYGSDFVETNDQTKCTPDERGRVVEELAETYNAEIAYLTDGGEMEYRG